jgi:hypothetical protein
VAEGTGSDSLGAAQTTAHTYKSGSVVIEELAPGSNDACQGRASPVPAAAPAPVAALAPATATAPTTAPAGQPEDEEQEEVAELREVFDSSCGVATVQRQARAAWMAMPLSKKVRWAGARRAGVAPAASHCHLQHARVLNTLGMNQINACLPACLPACLLCRRWAQTSADVSVHVMLPRGTRAADVQV